MQTSANQESRQLGQSFNAVPHTQNFGKVAPNNFAHHVKQQQSFQVDSKSAKFKIRVNPGAGKSMKGHQHHLSS